MVPDKIEKFFGYIFFLGLILFIFLSGTTIISLNVSGSSNSTTLTKVNVTNTEPSIYSVTLTPSSVDLNAGGTKRVNCTAFVYDLNGGDDITYANATLYDTSQGYGKTTDNNYRYRNESCSCIVISTNNASCSCLFDVWYYANSGSWECNITAYDSYNIGDTAVSNTITVNEVIGIDSSSEIDYGQISVTQTSDEKTADIINIGNVPINITVRGYGGDDRNNPQNSAMVCEQGTIPIGYEKFSITSGQNYDSMTALSNNTISMGITLPVRTNDTSYDNDKKQSYWRIYIPSSVAGYCNGTIEFFAIDAS